MCLKHESVNLMVFGFNSIQIKFMVVYMLLTCLHFDMYMHSNISFDSKGKSLIQSGSVFYYRTKASSAVSSSISTHPAKIKNNNKSANLITFDWNASVGLTLEFFLFYFYFVLFFCSAHSKA